MSGKYNSKHHKKWTRYKALPNGEEVGLDKFMWLMGVGQDLHPVYNDGPYTGYFNFSIDGNEVFASIYDHDEGCITGDNECLFEYEGNNLDEWETGIDVFTKHQEKWSKWKTFVEEYRKFYEVKKKKLGKYTPPKEGEWRSNKCQNNCGDDCFDWCPHYEDKLRRYK